MIENLHYTPMFCLATLQNEVGVEKQYSVALGRDTQVLSMVFKQRSITDGKFYVPPGSTVQITVYEKYKTSKTKYALKKGKQFDKSDVITYKMGVTFNCEDLDNEAAVGTYSNALSAFLVPYVCYKKSTIGEWYYIKMTDVVDEEILKVNINITSDCAALYEWNKTQKFDGQGNPVGEVEETEKPPTLDLNILAEKIVKNYLNIDNTFFVILLYREILSRDADVGGKNFWVSLLDRNVFSRSDVVKYFYLSEEYLGRFK